MTWNWTNYCVGIIEQVAREKEEFTSDDVQEKLEIRPPNVNMVGAAFEQAKARGYITATKTVVPSGRREAKGRNIQLWRSNLYKQPVLFEIPHGPPSGEMSAVQDSRRRCTRCARKHGRKDAFGQLTELCDRCANEKGREIARPAQRDS